MSSYLGKIGHKDSGQFEIHALTNGVPFRWLRTSDVSDYKLFDDLIGARYRMLQGDPEDQVNCKARPFYCTAISPDKEREVETNPHDYREGTIHIVSVEPESGRVVAGLSVAADPLEKDGGRFIGVPLENRWHPNGYPEGSSLDEFRERYIRLNRNEDRNIEPMEIGELYRHFIDSSMAGNKAIRLGLYTGAYHLLVREARKRNQTTTDIWVFDAMPSYFQLYKWAGAAGLRDITIEDIPRWVSPGTRHLEKSGNGNGDFDWSYKGEVISRDVQIPIPNYIDGELKFALKAVPFLDGVVDISRVESMIRSDPLKLDLMGTEGFNMKDRAMLRVALSTIGKRAFEDVYDGGLKDKITESINHASRVSTGTDLWDFNGTGDRGGIGFDPQLEKLYSTRFD